MDTELLFTCLNFSTTPAWLLLLLAPRAKITRWLVHSAAIPEVHPQLEAARERGITTWKYAELLGETGVETVNGLRTASPGDLAEALREVNREKRLAKTTPSPTAAPKASLDR